MKVSYIEITGFNKVANKRYTFSEPVTYLQGANGSGKTTVLQAIQLALLGYIPGSAKNSNEIIYRHANQRILNVRLCLQGDTESIIVERSWTRVKANVVTEVTITPDSYVLEDIIRELELPVFNFNEFVGMTANKLKDWFIEFLPKSDTSIDWNAKLLAAGSGLMSEDALNQLVVDTADAIRAFNLSGVDEIRKANDYIKAGLKYKKDELQRLQSTIQSLIFYDDCDDSQSLEDIRKQIEATTYQLTQAIANNTNAERNAAIRRRLSELATDIDMTESIESDSHLDELKSEYSECQDKYTSVTDSMKRIESELANIDSEISIKNQILNSDAICPFTKKTCEDITSLKDQYTRDVASLNSTKMEKIDALKPLMSQRSSLAKQIDTLKSDIEYITNVYAEYKQLAKQLTSEAAIIDVSDIQNKLTELRNIQVKLEANRRYNEMIDRLTSDKYKIEQTLDCYKAWDKLTGTNGLQSEGSATLPFELFAADMDKYLAVLFEDAKCKFNIVSKANSFSFGIERGDTYVPFDSLSSGERCLYTLALLICIVKQMDSEFKLIMIDDLLDHLDDENMIKLCNLTSACEDVQMIFAGVKSIPDVYRGGIINVEV